MKEQAKQFFAHYGNTFDTWDMKKFSSFFHEPFISIRGDGTSRIMQDNIEAEIFFTSVLAKWKRDGYVKFSTKDYEVISLGTKSMLVTFTWQMMNKEDKIIKEWRQSYNLINENQTWKIIMSTFHLEDKRNS